MAPRQNLDQILKTILGSEERVYFQPPENIKMRYPAIVYSLDDVDTDFASNKPYLQTKRYQVTVIDRDPDSVIPDKVGSLPLCTFSRFAVVDNLNQYIYSLYF